MELARLSLSFSAGFLAMMAPCALPMLPSYIAFFLNAEGKEAKLSSAILFGLITVLGFLTIFFSIGLIPSVAVNLVSRNSNIFTILIGLFLILLGFLSGWTDIMSRIPMFNFSTSDSSGIRAFFFYGLGYGLASLTCSLPIFLLVVLHSAMSASFIEILFSFISYGLGAATLMIPLTIALVYSKDLMYRKIMSILPYVKKISGLILIIAGIYMIISSRNYTFNTF